MQNKITAKDFFLQLGAIAAFYACIIALITLLFEVINYAYPSITNAYQYYLPSISLQVATLMVAFPLFIFISWTLQKSYAAEPSLRDAPVRKWLAFVTLFIAGAVVAGNLITLIYMYLDGRELTAGFLLKVLVLLLIAGGVFAYYLREIKNIISPKERSVWRVVAGLVALVSIVLGFMVIGSPAAQREYRLDMQRTSHLQDAQWQIVTYWQQKGTLPATLDELRDPIRSTMIPVDPATGEAYEYTPTGPLSFDLCATFSRESRNAKRPIGSSSTYPMPIRDVYHPGGPEGDNWQHGAGRECFSRTIDPELYPQVGR